MQFRSQSRAFFSRRRLRLRLLRQLKIRLRLRLRLLWLPGVRLRLRLRLLAKSFDSLRLRLRLRLRLCNPAYNVHVKLLFTVRALAVRNRSVLLFLYNFYSQSPGKSLCSSQLASLTLQPKMNGFSLPVITRISSSTSSSSSMGS